MIYAEIVWTILRAEGGAMRAIRRIRARLGSANSTPIKRDGNLGVSSQAAEVVIQAGPLKGSSLFLDLRYPVCLAMSEGRFESFIYDALVRLDPFDSRVVWDVGAHWGYHSLALARLVGATGRVVAFEPNPHNLERLRKNLELNPTLSSRVEVVPIALSDSDGSAPFLASSDVETGRSSESHLKGASAPFERAAYSAFEERSVQTGRADSIIRDQSHATPSLIKVDVEGAESKVLDGARELLTSVRPTLLIEIHSIISMFRVQSLLTKAGYVLQVIHESPEPPGRCFIVAVHESMSTARPTWK